MNRVTNSVLNIKVIQNKTSNTLNYFENKSINFTNQKPE